MCDLDHHDHSNHFGFLVDTPAIRALIDETRRLTAAIPDVAARVAALRPAFEALLASDGWLPESCATPDQTSKMAAASANTRSIARRTARSVCSRSSFPVGAATPVHDHLAWGLVGIYRGRQDETSTAGSTTAAIRRARISRSRTTGARRGECYTLAAATDDIHYVSTISDTPSISIHLLANDTACVWRHRFEPATGAVTPFRSGYANAPCPPES